MTSNCLAFDFVTTYSEGLGGSVSISEINASSSLTIPTCTDSGTVLSIETGYNRKFELKYFDQVYAAAVYSNPNYSLAVGFSQFGKTDFYTESLLKISSSLKYKIYSFGLTASSFDINFGNHYPKVSDITIGLSTSFKIKKIYAAFVADNLTKPNFNLSAPPVQPRYTIFSEYSPSKIHTLLGRVTIEKYRTPTYSFAEIIDVSRKLSIFLSMSNSPLKYGGGFKFNYQKHKISYSLSYHPILGFSYHIIISYTEVRI